MKKQSAPQVFSLSQRAAGVLLHPTSLPGGHGCGDLGPAAYQFVDFLAEAGQRWWQVLPLHPVGPGNSPYSATSAFAGSPLLISLDALVEEGLLSDVDVRPTANLRAERVAYGATARFKMARLRKAYRSFVGAGGLTHLAFRQFCQLQSGWLDDEVLFTALRRRHRGQSWITWPRGLRLRHRPALRAAVNELRDELDFERFLQFVFDCQWSALRRYANAAGVGLIGDLPMFVAHDSSDVWAHCDLFDLDAGGRAKTVSGVPPDYFSDDGQLWGHPQYRWARHRRTGFAWWVARFRRIFEYFDAVRIDHFLGFNRCWAVSSRARTARRGEWIKTPGTEILNTLKRRLGRLEIIAEDLGLLIPEAAALRERFGFPGLRLLQFAFGNDEGDRYNQPHNYPRNCVVYPGTHDNDTAVGWLKMLKRAHRRRRDRHGFSPYERALRYTGSDGREIHWDLIRLAFQSPANTAIIPAQDLLGLDNRARMNTPATSARNWTWRLPAESLTPDLAYRLRDLSEAYERCEVCRR